MGLYLGDYGTVSPPAIRKHSLLEQIVLQIMQEASSTITKLGDFMYNQTSLHKAVLLIAPLPTPTELAVPYRAGQDGALLPAESLHNRKVTSKGCRHQSYPASLGGE